MAMFLTFKTGLDSNKFHAGLTEICSHFDGNCSDEYMSGLLDEVKAATRSLVDAVNVKVAKQGISREAKLLNERLASASRYIDSCCYEPDEAVRTSAKALKKRFKAEAKPFNHMKVDTRVGSLRVLLRDFATAEMQAHVARLPEMASRIEGIQSALDVLSARQLEVDQANSQAVPAQPLLPLKRDAATKLLRLTEYLKVMSEKDKAAYGGHYDVVTEIITRINTQSRSKGAQISVELSDEEETAEETQQSVEP